MERNNSPSISKHTHAQDREHGNCGGAVGWIVKEHFEPHDNRTELKSSLSAPGFINWWPLGSLS